MELKPRRDCIGPLSPSTWTHLSGCGAWRRTGGPLSSQRAVGPPAGANRTRGGLSAPQGRYRRRRQGSSSPGSLFPHRRVHRCVEFRNTLKQSEPLRNASTCFGLFYPVVKLLGQGRSMETEQLLDDLKRFAADLSIAGQPVAIDFVMEKHLNLFAEARRSGLRWSGLARLLAQAGAGRADGSALTTDQIRASFSRVQRRQIERTRSKEQRELGPRAVQPATSDVSPDRRVPVRTATIVQGVMPSIKAPSSARNAPVEVGPDLSDAEIESARRRLGDL